MARRRNFAFDDASFADREKFYGSLVTGEGDACWGWTGRHQAGYPIFKGTLVRRLLPAAFPALFTDADRHARRWTTTCQHTGCTNPSHLRAGKPSYVKQVRRTEDFVCAWCHQTKQRKIGSTRPFCSPRCRTAAGQEQREAAIRRLLDQFNADVKALTVRKAPRGRRTL